SLYPATSSSSVVYAGSSTMRKERSSILKAFPRAIVTAWFLLAEIQMFSGRLGVFYITIGAIPLLWRATGAQFSG
ncbi:MAG: hypothetical protein KH142_08805, partial [Slackia piriformis]|nr:hypothetical protein [Slackia piriformis]